MAALSLVLAALTLAVPASSVLRLPPEADSARWIGPAGAPLPFLTEPEVLEFLRMAEIVSDEVIHQGVNASRKVLLERDGVRAYAVFRSVEERLNDDRLDRKSRSAFRDSAVFECAAYELDRLLGIEQVPPTVERRYRGHRGSLQLWIENAMDEQERRRRYPRPPDPTSWARDAAVRVVFDALIHNQDRNLGNLLVDPSWRVWLIDHTRSFSSEKTLRNREQIGRCSRKLWDRLRDVDRESVRERLAPYLEAAELRALFVRWDKLVRHLQEQIERRGEQEVLLAP